MKATKSRVIYSIPADDPSKSSLDSMVAHLKHHLQSLLTELERSLADIESLENISNVGVDRSLDLKKELDKFEVTMIRRALDQTHGNQSLAASLLRLKPTTLNVKIKKYGIPIDKKPLGRRIAAVARQR